MGVVTGPSMLKFMTIIFYAVVLLGIVAGIISGFVTWNKTGDWKPVVDATLGQVVYWDGQIETVMSVLTDDAILGKIPENLRDDYKAALAKQILLYLALFAIASVLLYKFGNWIAGKSQFEPTTDLMIFIAIIGIFALAEFFYGMLMDKPNIVPFKGIISLFRNFDVWWNALSGVATTATQPVATQLVDSAGQVIDISGG